VSSKDYVLIARIIRANADRVHEHPSHEVVGDLAADMATALQSENPSFDRSRFLSACGFPKN
jgi:hypothetical protein